MRFKTAANLTPPCAKRRFTTGTREEKYFSASVEPSETPLYAESQAAWILSDAYLHILMKTESKLLELYVLKLKD